jgi:pimeloyl-ACP methyl ester carboxylesterase
MNMARESTTASRRSRKSGSPGRQEAATSDSSTAPPPVQLPPWVRLVNIGGTETPEDQIKQLVHEQVALDLAGEPVASEYTVIFFYDALAIARSDTDQLYKTLNKAPTDKPLLLVLHSMGGDVAAAYFIAKLCRERTTARFDVAVPRRAKSAATLICCGADHVHMGSLSELGPIDPQFEGIPALALKNSIEHLAELTKRHPQAADMFASYLAKTLRIEALGYYERVAESAAQYAERLLLARRNTPPSDAEAQAIAQRLVYMYKDHGFAIDGSEATGIFGGDIVKMNTPEYELADKLYRSLDLIGRILRDLHSLEFAFTGDAKSGCQLRKRPGSPAS